MRYGTGELQALDILYIYARPVVVTAGGYSRRSGRKSGKGQIAASDWGLSAVSALSIEGR